MDTVVIGASGLVGSHVARRIEAEGFEVTGTYHTSPTEEATVQVDKTDEPGIHRLISHHDPDLVIDTAAFHDVDACELQRDKAWFVNAAGTRNVAVAADNVGAHYVFLSTDYVFPGNRESAPYAETDPINPVNYYGQCKYAGEQAAKIADLSTVLRTSVIYGVSNDNFLTWALKELRESAQISVVDDQVATPTFAGDVAEACLKIGQQRHTGLFHASGPESISRYEFVRRLAEMYGCDHVDVNPILTEELDQRAQRPVDSSLDSTKLYETVEFEFRDTTAALEEIRS